MFDPILWSKINKKSDIASPTFTGIPTAPTAAPRDNSTQIANTAFIKGEIDYALTTVYIPKGTIAFESLPTPSVSVKGFVYNVSNNFTADTNFRTEDIGKAFPAGTNVACVDVGSEDYKWDCMAGFIDLSAIITKLGYISTGGSAAISANFNAITVNGFYTGYGAAIGAPNTSYSWFVIHQNSNVNNDSATQRAIAYNSTLIAYERVKINGTWGAWINKSEFISTIGTVTSNAFTADCSVNQNYVITNAQDVTLTISNAPSAGVMYQFIIDLYGGKVLTLPANCIDDPTNGYNTITDDTTQYYSYLFTYKINADGDGFFDVQRSVKNVYTAV